MERCSGPTTVFHSQPPLLYAHSRNTVSLCRVSLNWLCASSKTCRSSTWILFIGSFWEVARTISLQVVAVSVCDWAMKLTGLRGFLYTRWLVTLLGRLGTYFQTFCVCVNFLEYWEQVLTLRAFTLFYLPHVASRYSSVLPFFEILYDLESQMNQQIITLSHRGFTL